MDLRGPGIILVLLLCCFLAEQFGNVTPTIDFKNKFEYIPIITANIYADLLIIFLTFTGLLYNSTTLIAWYKKYRLSAMIGDIVIGILYIVAARYLVHIFQWNIGLTVFALLAVAVQIIGDLAFYAFFWFTHLRQLASFNEVLILITNILDLGKTWRLNVLWILWRATK
jgi:hypothetical protein